MFACDMFAFCFFKQKTAYEMRISDWSSDVCSSDLNAKRDSLAGILAEAGPDYDMSKVKSVAGDTSAKVAEIGKINAEIDECKQKVDELLVVARAADRESVV